MSSGAENDDFSPTLSHLFKEVSWLCTCWDLNESIVSRTDDRISLLNRRTGRVFRVFQLLTTDAILLGLARALGSKSSVGHDVMTLERAIDELPDNVAETKGKLQARLTALRHACKAIRDHRNKRIAHSDLLNSKSLPSVRRDEVSAALIELYELVSATSAAATGTSYGPPAFEGRTHDADVLFKILENGNAEIDQRNLEKRKRFQQKSGKEPSEDFDDPLDTLIY